MFFLRLVNTVITGVKNLAEAHLFLLKVLDELKSAAPKVLGLSAFGPRITKSALIGD